MIKFHISILNSGVVVSNILTTIEGRKHDDKANSLGAKFSRINFPRLQDTQYERDFDTNIQEAYTSRLFQY